MTNTRRQRIANNRHHMETRTILEERVVHHNEFPDLSQFFVQNGCFSFLDLDEMIYPSLVREFYAHLDLSNPEQVTFRLFNEPYSWTISHFATIMEIPSHGRTFYTPRTDLRSLHPVFPTQEILDFLTIPGMPRDLNQRIRLQDVEIRHDLQLLLNVIQSNIYCRDATTIHLSGTEIAIMWSLLAHEPINFAYIMTQRMENLRELPNRPLPYANHLNRLFRAIGAITPNHIPQPVSTIPITFWVEHPVVLLSSDTEGSTLSDAFSTNGI